MFKLYPFFLNLNRKINYLNEENYQTKKSIIYAMNAKKTLTSTITNKSPFKLNFLSFFSIRHNYEQYLWQKKI